MQMNVILIVFLQAVPFHQCSDLPLYTIKYITKITIKTYTYFLFLLHLVFMFAFVGYDTGGFYGDVL